MRAMLVALLATLVASPAAANETVKMGELPAISTVGIYVAIDRGFFEEKGITVDLQRFASGGKMIAPLATGEIDVATGAPSAGLFNAIAGGMDFKIVADKGEQRPAASFCPVVIRKDLVDSGRVKTLADLKGLKISTGAKGITMDYDLAKMLEHVGLKYDDVDMVQLSYPESVKALAAKAIDGMIGPEPWGVLAEEKGAGKRMFLTEQVPSIASLQIAVVMYSGKFIKERPQVARDFMQAYVKGVRYYRERGLKDAEIAGILSKHTGVSVQTIKATIPFYIDPDARPRVKDLEAFQEWFHKMGWTKTMVPIDKAVDLSFLK
jgi:NitT/TauT family transport system substrate-binding protein